MEKVKAIETFYAGYRFRSRLEARWAVFSATLGVPFEYEKEGFDGRSARLPCDCAAQRADPVYGPSDKDYNTASPRLRAAYLAARQARFEHGETPRVPR